MANYTAFVSSPRVSTPMQNEEGAWICYITSDVLLMDGDGAPVPPWGMTDMPWASAATINSLVGLVPSDSLATVRNKILAAVRVNWAPTVVASDGIRAVFLDSGTLLNL